MSTEARNRTPGETAFWAVIVTAFVGVVVFAVVNYQIYEGHARKRCQRQGGVYYNGTRYRTDACVLPTQHCSVSLYSVDCQ